MNKLERKAAMIVAASGGVAPLNATADDITRQSKRADDYIRNKASQDEQREDATDTATTTNNIRERIAAAWSDAVKHIGVGFATGVALAIIGIFGFLAYWGYKRVCCAKVKQKESVMPIPVEEQPKKADNIPQDVDIQDDEENEPTQKTPSDIVNPPIK